MPGVFHAVNPGRRTTLNCGLEIPGSFDLGAPLRCAPWLGLYDVPESPGGSRCPRFSRPLSVPELRPGDRNPGSDLAAVELGLGGLEGIRVAGRMTVAPASRSAGEVVVQDR